MIYYVSYILLCKVLKVAVGSVAEQLFQQISLQENAQWRFVEMSI